MPGHFHLHTRCLLTGSAQDNRVTCPRVLCNLTTHKHRSLFPLSIQRLVMGKTLGPAHPAIILYHIIFRSGPRKSYIKVEFFHFLKKVVDDKPLNGGLFSGGWWLTILRVIGDRHLENRLPSFGWLVTIFWMVDDHPCDGGWPSRGW